MNTRNCGYTLIELIVTLSIALLLASLALQGISQLRRSTDSLFDKRIFIDALSLARTSAISQGRTITSCLSNDGRKCHRDAHVFMLVFADSDNSKTVDPGELIFQMTFIDQQASMKLRVSGGRHYIRFKATGTVKEFGSINYCPSHGDARHATRIILNLGGRLRLPLDSNGNGIPENKPGEDIQC
jgi:type IV fimbrial biogenesis protein FimT